MKGNIPQNPSSQSIFDSNRQVPISHNSLSNLGKMIENIGENHRHLSGFLKSSLPGLVKTSGRVAGATAASVAGIPTSAGTAMMLGPTLLAVFFLSIFQQELIKSADGSMKYLKSSIGQSLYNFFSDSSNFVFNETVYKPYDALIKDVFKGVDSITFDSRQQEEVFLQDVDAVISNSGNKELLRGIFNELRGFAHPTGSSPSNPSLVENLGQKNLSPVAGT